MRIRGRQARLPTRALARVVALCAVAGGFSFAGAAPAAATPVATDFEQRLPAIPARSTVTTRVADHGHPGEGPVTHRGPVIKAPAHFDAVGLAYEQRPLEMRARENGRNWSEWIVAADGDPAWFGGADELQVRARGWRPSGKLLYVSVTDEPSPPATLARDLTKPKIVSRTAWGADQGPRRGCQPRVGPEYGQARAVVVHHTVSSVDYTKAEAPGMILAICRFHRDGQGWNDVGYNAFVDRFGTIYEGRDGGLRRPVIGAHAQGFNGQTAGVAALGTHTKLRVTKSALRGLTRFIAWKLVVHGHAANDKARLKSAGGSASRYPAGRKITTNRIIGHRRVGLTECPGTALNRQLPSLIKRAQRRIEANGGSGDGSSGGVS